jgi:signal transduction histidine kinase
MLRIARVGALTKKANDISHITQEMYKKNLELAELNKTLSLLEAIDAIVLSSVTDTREAANAIAATVLKETDFASVIISILDPANGSLSVYGGAGDAADLMHFAPEMRVSRLPAIRSVLQKQRGAHFSSWEKLLASPKSKLKPALAGTVFVQPLLARQRPLGILVIRSTLAAAEISDFKLNLIERLGNTIGIAIDSKLLSEEIAAASVELRQKNRKLKELDKAKDDFISMASHQLRTPLTTVKGYLSMMLEGDTGKLAEQQRRVIDLAYFSAQRMVFLINDLLNVSRINTGKFVIEPSPVNLREMVQTEMTQLERTAEGRGVKLASRLPDEFSTVMLDENKIRQVMMNFIDNAIYYTRPGGTVNIELIDAGPAIEFRVVDTGIGVSEKDKPKLFGKFFRADNAKQQRPDGNGLGLFMAKKVITSHGGSVIFESREGVGSTFGFRFAKAVLGMVAPPAKKPASKKRAKK